MNHPGGRWIFFLSVAIVGCAPGYRGPDVTPAELPSLEAERARRPTDHQLLLRLGAAYYRAERYDLAVDVLRAAAVLRPTFAGAVFLGLSFEGQGRLDSALVAYRGASALAGSGAERAELDARLAALTRLELAESARRAVARERELAATPPPANAVAVLPWRYLGANPELAPLEKGIAHLILTDLSKVPSLVLLERERVQALTDEIRLTAAQRVEAASGARSGRLLRAARVVQGSLRDEARGDNLRLDATVVATQTGAITARGGASDRLAELFALQKRVVFDLLRQMGITLSAAERQAIGERPTADLQAFLAFSRGLDAEDRGDFATAASQFNAAAARDPSFRAARDRAAAAVRLGAAAARPRTELVGLAGRSLAPLAGPSAGRAISLRDAIDVVAPSSGGRLGRRTLARLPLARSRLTEALRQDDPTAVGIGEIIIVIPRP